MFLLHECCGCCINVTGRVWNQGAGSQAIGLPVMGHGDIEGKRIIQLDWIISYQEPAIFGSG